MYLSKVYSHGKYIKRNQQKQKCKQINLDDDDDEYDFKKRSVTYNEDVELMDSIISKPNLLNYIQSIQKLKHDISTTIEENNNLHLPQLLSAPRKNITQRNTKRNDENEYINHSTNRVQRHFLFRNNNYQCIPQKSISKTIVFDTENDPEIIINSHKKRLNILKIKGLEEMCQEQQLKEQSFKFHKITQDYDQNFDDIYKEQNKLNNNIIQALRIKQQQRDPTNASKSLFQQRARIDIYLKKQYEKALDEETFVKKLGQLQKKLKKQSDDIARSRLIPNQYIKHTCQPESVHRRKLQFVSKTFEIQDQCTEILEQR